MDNEKRYSTRIKSERCDKIKISSVAAVFLVCSIAIFATRYRQDIWNFDRENGNDHQIENVATGSDASEEIQKINVQIQMDEKIQETDRRERTRMEEPCGLTATCVI